MRQWVIDNREGFSAHYTRARDIGLDALADEAIEIADTPMIGEKRKVKGTGDTAEVEVTTGDMVERARLRVEARKWYLSKLAPKKYGDKLEVSGTLNHTHHLKEVAEMSDDELDGFIKSESNK